VLTWLVLLESRGSWGGGAPARERKYNIRVCARLRPLGAEALASASEAGRGHVVLPLHQRLQLIQATEHCNRTESQRRLWESRGGLPDAWTAAAAKVPRDAGDDAAMEEDRDGGGWRAKEADQGVSACVLSTAGGPGGHVLMCCPAGAGIRRFAMDHVLTDAASQEETYVAAAGEAVQRFIAGQNACIFAYGQTGSGKSHTMFGATDETSYAVPLSAAGACAEAGVVPRACGQVLAEARAISESGGHASVSLSMVELYGESITDLLAQQPVTGNATGTIIGRQKPIVAAAVLRGRHSVPVHTHEECAAALARGISNRKRAATAMNDHSSRAHTAIILHLKTSCAPNKTAAAVTAAHTTAPAHTNDALPATHTTTSDNGGAAGWGRGAGGEVAGGEKESVHTTDALSAANTTTSDDWGAAGWGGGGGEEVGSVEKESVSRNLCLVDLGGAEQVSKSILTHAAKRVVAPGDVAERIQEAVFINLGLLALKKCVRALVADDPHVPFNDAKLTTMLRGALRGDCVTSVVVTCR